MTVNKIRRIIKTIEQTEVIVQFYFQKKTKDNFDKKTLLHSSPFHFHFILCFCHASFVLATISSYSSSNF